MAQSGVMIAAAGGREDGGMGTSIEKVTAALQAVTSPDGILVLLDLGSAVMIAEMAIEALTEEEKRRTVISSAPLVEGAVLAALEAASGSSLQEVVEAANEGVKMPKVRQE
jgi:dihydroxyacetone kinase DhaKLM complex PTS-EIIA-like component DhaM